jgi:predicted DCC family thiol-disulfide oxidoreductase YuxK
MADDGPILLHDGHCRLCDAAVQLVLALDRRQRFRFAARDSEAARARLAAVGVTLPSTGPGSVVLLDGGRVFLRSEAVLGIASRLGAPWSFAGIARVLPRRWRDALYDALARHRHRLGGRLATCRIPDAAVRARFLDADERTQG